MPLFSELLRYHVEDAQGRRERLLDVTLQLAENDDYPRVTGLLVRSGCLPWSEVSGLSRDDRRFKVHDLDAGQEAPPADVMCKRDVYDSLVLDLQHRRATRANDLIFADREGELRLVGADVSARAVLRRLTGGWLGRHQGECYDWKYVEFLRGDPTAVRRGAGYHRRIAKLPAGDITFLCQAISYLEAAELLTLLPDALAAEVLQGLPIVRQAQIAGELDPAQLVALVRLMAPDLAADLLGALGTSRAQRILNALDAPASQRILDLLQYAPETVGGIMTNDLVELPAAHTVEQARATLALRSSRFINTLYVSDDEHGLHGTLELMDILRAKPEQVLGELANPYVQSLQSAAPSAPACYQVLRSGLPALPVLDEKGHLLGAVTADVALTRVVPVGLSDQLPRVLS